MQYLRWGTQAAPSEHIIVQHPEPANEVEEVISAAASSKMKETAAAADQQKSSGVWGYINPWQWSYFNRAAAPKPPEGAGAGPGPAKAPEPIATAPSPAPAPPAPQPAQADSGAGLGLGLVQAPAAAAAAAAPVQELPKEATFEETRQKTDAAGLGQIESIKAPPLSHWGKLKARAAQKKDSMIQRLGNAAAAVGREKDALLDKAKTGLEIAGLLTEGMVQLTGDIAVAATNTLVDKAKSGLEIATLTTTGLTEAVGDLAVNMGKVGVKGLTYAVLEKINTNTAFVNVEEEIDRAKERMRAFTGGDRQYIEFYKFLSDIIMKNVRDQFNALDNANPAKTLTLDTVETIARVNIANAFANLAESIHKRRDQIPNFENQSFLVNAISVFSQIISKNASFQKLRDIQASFKPQQKADLLAELDPLMIADAAKKQQLLQKLQELHKNHAKFYEIENTVKRLFPNFDQLPDPWVDDIQSLLDTIKKEVKQEEDLTKIFGSISGEIFTLLFPDKFLGIFCPGIGSAVTGTSFIHEKIFKMGLDSIGSFLKDQFAPMNNPEQRAGWAKQIQDRVGMQGIETLTQGPTILMRELLKNFIQTDLNLPEFVNEKILKQVAVNHPEEENLATTPHEKAIQEMSEKQLASWIVDGLHALLHSNDPAIANAGFFVNDMLQNLMLGLMAKGTELVIPQAEQVAPNEFIKKVLIDRLIAKIKALSQAGEITEQDLKDFLSDMPLPPLVKDLLSPLLAAKSKELQKVFDPFKKSHELYQSAFRKFQAMEGGQQLLSLTGKLTNEIVDAALRNNQELMDATGLSDTLENLLTQFLPGMKIDEELKAWFKSNISSFGVDPAQTYSIGILKESIHAVILHSLATTIETQFNGHGDKFAEQLISKMQQGFATAFPRFSDAERELIEDAWYFHSQISGLKLDRNQLQYEIEELNNNLVYFTRKHDSAPFREVLRLTEQHDKAWLHIVALTQKYEHIVDLLTKEGGKVAVWAQDISKVKEILEFHKAVLPRLVPIKEALPGESELELIQRAKRQVEDALVKELAGSEPDHESIRNMRADIEDYKRLIRFFELPEEQLAYLKDCITLKDNIENTTTEMEDLAKRATDLEVSLSVGTLPKWKAKAVETMVKLIEKRREIIKLDQTILKTERELDGRLHPFQDLAQEWISLFGLGQKESLLLPPFLTDMVWPQIQSAKVPIARVLFEQLSPVIMTYFDHDANKAELQRLTGSTFAGDLCNLVAKETLDRIPAFVSYKPAVLEFMKAFKIDDPTDEEIDSLTKAVLEEVLKEGKNHLTSAGLKQLLAGKVADERQDALVRELHQLIRADQLTSDKALALLRGVMSEKDIKIFLFGVNQLILGRGKKQLIPETLYRCFTKGISSIRRHGIDKAKALQTIVDKGLIGKFQSVAATPDEVSHLLSEIIPGTEELQNLLSPQLNEVISGKNPTYQGNRDLLQQFIESILLKHVTNIVKKNGGANFVTQITAHVNGLFETVGLVDNTELASDKIVDSVLANVLGIKSTYDLAGVPPVARDFIYDVLKQQLHLQISPLIAPMVERQRDRLRLNEISKSPFLSNLSAAVAKDVISFVPYTVNSYRDFAKKVFDKLSEGRAVTPQQFDVFAAEVEAFVAQSKVQVNPKVIKNTDFIKAYEKAVSRTPYTPDVKAEFRAKLKEMNVKGELGLIQVQPQQIGEVVAQLLPGAKGQIQNELVTKLQTFLHSNDAAYQNVTGIAQQYVEDVLLKLFIRITEKNPPAAGKDVLVVLTENLLNLVKSKYKDIKEQSFEAVLPSFVDEILGNVLGIDSPDALGGIPKPVQTIAYKMIREHVTAQLNNLYQHLQTVSSSQARIQAAKENLKQRLGTSAAEAAEVVLSDLGDLVVTSTLHTLHEPGDFQPKGVTQITEAARRNLDAFAKGNIEAARVLYDFVDTPGFKEGILGANITDAQQLAREERTKAAELVGNLLLEPLNKGLSALLDIEEQRGAEFDQKLAASVMKAAAGHLKTINAAKKLAKTRGQADFTHADFVKAAGAGIHPAVPVEEVSYSKVLKKMEQFFDAKIDPAKKEDLLARIRYVIKEDQEAVRPLRPEYLIAMIREFVPKDLTIDQAKEIVAMLREAAEANKMRRWEKFYKAEMTKGLNFIFPNGQNDLTFVAPELRGFAWKIMKEKLFPLVLPIVTESIMDENILLKIVTNSLLTMKDTLKAELARTEAAPPGPPENPEMDELDKACGALLSEAIDLTQLNLPRFPGWRDFPEWVKGNIKSEAVQKALGRVMRGQFNGTFMKEKLKVGLEKAAERVRVPVEGGEIVRPTILFDTRPKAEKDLQAAADKREMEGKVESLTSELVDINVAVFLKQKLESKLEEIKTKYEWFGRLAPAMRTLAEKLFRFLFATVTLALFRSGTQEMRPWIKKQVHKFMNLDENRKIVMDVLRKAPIDQPYAENRVVYHEDLAYKLVAAFEEALVPPAPVVPQEAE